MLLRRLADFILKNRTQGMGVAFICSLIPVVGSSISILIVGLVTLRKGAFEGTLVFIASILPYLLNYVTYPASESGLAEIVFISTLYVMVSNMLMWLFALMLRRFNNWSLTLESIALVGIMVVMLLHLFYPDIAGWWVKELTSYYHKTASLLAPPVSDMVSKGMTSDVIATEANYATGSNIALLLVMVMLQLLIARWWQAITFNPGGLRKELHQIRLSYVSGLIFILMILLWCYGNTLSMDMIPIVLIVFCAAGLSLIHGLVAARKAGWFWLALVYLGIFFTFPIGMVAVAIAALLDTVFDFRKRLCQ